LHPVLCLNSTDWSVYEEGEEACEEDEETSEGGTPAELFGFKDLLAKWPRVEKEVKG